MANIEFISTVPGLEDIEECRPRPAKHFMPKWFKDVPATLTPEQKAVKGAISGPGVSTVKICPSFPDYFSLGYILPMWCDVKLFHNPENGEWNWQTSSDTFAWDIHGNPQFLDWVSPEMYGSKASFVFKSGCPWRIKTPPGWSVLQLPLYYHFNEKWSVLPGVIDTDIHHEINQQTLYYGDGMEVTIERGEPFVLYIPFERKSKLNLEIRTANEEDTRLFKAKDLEIASKFPPSGLYRKWQRLRDRHQ